MKLLVKLSASTNVCKKYTFRRLCKHWLTFPVAALYLALSSNKLLTASSILGFSALAALSDLTRSPCFVISWSNDDASPAGLGAALVWAGVAPGFQSYKLSNLKLI